MFNVFCDEMIRTPETNYYIYIGKTLQIWPHVLS